jgi:hypothetical protein
MIEMRVFILGAGATGGLLAQLLRQRGFTVWCGDRDPQRARSFIGRHFECRPANARSLRSVVRAARGCQLLVNAAPAVYNQTVVRAALRLRVHYLDLDSHLSRNPFKAEQFRFEDEFVRRGRLALINAGAAAGLTNLLVAACADTLDEVNRVRIRLFEDTECDTPISTWSAEVAHDEAISKPRIFRQGRFRFARRFGEAEWFRFPKPIGEIAGNAGGSERSRDAAALYRDECVGCQDRWQRNESSPALVSSGKTSSFRRPGESALSRHRLADKSRGTIAPTPTAQCAVCGLCFGNWSADG